MDKLILFVAGAGIGALALHAYHEYSVKKGTVPAATDAYLNNFAPRDGNDGGAVIVAYKDGKAIYAFPSDEAH